MFEDPEETPAERSIDPSVRARDKLDEFRMHAELAAIFEATRKFEAQVLPTLDPDIARGIQHAVARLEKARSPESPLLPEASTSEAISVLNAPTLRGLSTNDYHVYRRPGELMIVRWLVGEQVETFYGRLQAHFEAALTQFRDAERQSLEWKQDPQTLKYLDELDKIEVKMADRYLREIIRQQNALALSTQSADEIDILYLTDYLMGATPEDLVGPTSAPGEAQTEQERAWFFKLFSLRGLIDGIERMCFFSFLQKADEGW